MKTGKDKQSTGTVSEIARGRKAVKALDDLVNRCELFLHSLHASENLCRKGEFLHGQATTTKPDKLLVFTRQQVEESRSNLAGDVFSMVQDFYKQAFEDSVLKAKELLEPAGEAKGA